MYFYITLKGYSTPRWQFCQTLTPMSFQTRKSLVRLHSACDCPIDQVNYTVEAQKSMKNIVKIVQWLFYEAMRILFVIIFILFAYKKYSHSFITVSKAANPQLLPGSHSINDCPLLRVCIHRVCVFTAVCVHFGWVNCRAQIQSMGHHTWSCDTSRQIELLMADGLFWQCFSYLSGPQRC